ncbi:NAD(P)-dependent oxidoreductase [Amycolatopsis sp. SID8362]|uniref:NAD-dependent epimerase/dehydratase family protein n=1 Tax=Amycolatopsis sp. SID8362 TaxID=2690346 RepID=UPI0013709B20|nr:NAD(P)-dependent oxidoreductase [Amycolatopsis sp. SID8362]NBH10662.1 NAD-dependent epimerase/dehydratase family protein [Amycolatopsis sp. SID8362]NED47356.1 NAD(P)-dependent oxidoreductase [Amycolatopsis sp. SID8362]
MRVLVIGATGVLGVPTVTRLLAAGHEVSALTRPGSRLPAGVTGDLFSADSLVTALRGHDAVVNLATRIPRKPTSKKAWAPNDRVRSAGSAALAAAVRRVEEVRIVVQEGISFVYADGGSALLTEDAPLKPGVVTASSVTAHANVAALTDRTVVRLRIGTLLGPDRMTSALLAAARRGAPLILGSRSDWTTAIHPADAASAVVAALDAPSGVYNVGAPAVLKRDLGAAMAAAAGVRRARAVPKWLVSRIPLAEPMGRSQRVDSTKLREATGWECERPVPGPDWFSED